MAKKRKKEELTALPGGAPLGRRPIPTQEDLERHQGAMRENIPQAPLGRKRKSAPPIKPVIKEDYPVQERKSRKSSRKKPKTKRQPNKANRHAPVYDTSGKRIDKPQKDHKKLLKVATVFIFLIAILYVPGVFLKSPSQNTEAVTLSADSSMIRVAKQTAKEYPDADFDGDGLKNAKEESLGTARWNPDTDRDGLSDYAEINITKTDPLKANNTLQKIVKSSLKKAGKEISSPYMISNVKLWATTDTARTYGAIAETTTGFNFYNFEGYAQFPNNKYVYKIDEDGAHTLLEHRDDADAWKIDGDMEVETYDEPLNMTVQLGLLNNKKSFYIGSNAFTNILAFVLPDRGLLTSKKMAVIDTEADTSDATKVSIEQVDMTDEENLRFLENQNTLSDLNYVRKQIEDGYCVATSIYNPEKGEAKAICYGYDRKGDLLMADKDSLEPIGKLTITEKAAIIFNKDGKLKVRTWFEFKGLGYDSETEGDRINFFNKESSESQFGTPGSEDETQTEDQTGTETDSNSFTNDSAEDTTENTEGTTEGTGSATDTTTEDTTTDTTEEGTDTGGTTDTGGGFMMPSN